MTVYKVTAGTFQGHKEGDEFEAELDPELERRAKARGQIRVVKRDDDDQPKRGGKTSGKTDRS